MLTTTKQLEQAHDLSSHSKGQGNPSTVMWNRRSKQKTDRNPKTMKFKSLIEDHTRQLGGQIAKVDYRALVEHALQTSEERLQSKSLFDEGGLLQEPLKTIQEWDDVQIPPAKQRRVAGRMVPTVRGVAEIAALDQLRTRLWRDRTRKIALEIHGPPPDMRVQNDDTKPAPPEEDQTQTVQDTDNLDDHEIVVLRIYRTVPVLKDKDERDTDATDKHGVDVEENDSDEEEEYLSMRSFCIEDILLMDRRKNVCEVQVGSGEETKVYDLRFRTETDSATFADRVDRFRTSELERAKQQAEWYRVEKQNEVGEDSSIVRLLVEIVSATNLPGDTGTFGGSSLRNPFVKVKLGGSEIHRTRVCSNTVNPVWSLETGSLFLVEMDPQDFFSSTGGMTFVLSDYQNFTAVVGANQVLGRVRVGLNQIMEMKGERVSYEIAVAQDVKVSSALTPKLYLRFKEASPTDVQVRLRIIHIAFSCK